MGDVVADALQSLFKGGEVEPRNFCWWDCDSEGLTSTVLSYPWKLIQREDAVRGTRTFKTKGGTKPWLFNLENDQPETKNLAAQHPEKVEQLKAVFDKWVEQVPEPRGVRM